MSFLRSSIDARICASFLAPMPFNDRSFPAFAGLSQFVDALDVQRGVEHGHGLRADPLEAKQVEDRRRELLEQFLVVAARAGLGQFTNPRGEILANARYRAERCSSSWTMACGQVASVSAAVR